MLLWKGHIAYPSKTLLLVFALHPEMTVVCKLYINLLALSDHCRLAKEQGFFPSELLFSWISLSQKIRIFMKENPDSCELPLYTARHSFTLENYFCLKFSEPETLSCIKTLYIWNCALVRTHRKIKFCTYLRPSCPATKKHDDCSCQDS